MYRIGHLWVFLPFLEGSDLRCVTMYKHPTPIKTFGRASIPAYTMTMHLQDFATSGDQERKNCYSQIQCSIVLFNRFHSYLMDSLCKVKDPLPTTGSFWLQ